MITARSVRDIFGANGITKVAVIDDVFDAPGESFSATELGDLFDALRDSAAVRTSLSSAAIVLREPGHLTPNVISSLLRLAKSKEAGGLEAKVLIQDAAKRRRARLDRFASDLRRKLKLSVMSISPHAAKDQEKVVPDDSNVVFLDYELVAGEVQGELSSRLLKRIYEQFKGRDAVPLVVLMSNLRLTEEDVAKFQKRTELLSGMFYFVAKDDLFDTERLHYRLAAFAKALPTGQALQTFVHKIEDGLAGVQRKVFSDLRSLSISDFAFLQTLRLHDDGQPLGEYLMWLICAHLVQEIATQTEIGSAEKSVNALSFDNLPPTQTKPSASLGALYSSAVMRVMPPMPAAPGDPSGYLQFGDVFRKGSSKTVYVCITPPCDLAYSDTRVIPSERSVLMLPGALYPIEKVLKPFEQRQPRTELVQLGGKTYRAVWNTKAVERVAWRELQNWLGTSIKRVARLNTPFALEVQRAFATDLTRIGMPVPPPAYNPVKVRLSCLGSDGADLVLEAEADAVISGSDRGERLVLGPVLMDNLTHLLKLTEDASSARHLAATADSARLGPGPAAEALQCKQKVIAARTSAQIMSAFRGPFILPAVGEGSNELDDLLHISNEAPPQNASAWTPLRIQVLAPAET